MLLPKLKSAALIKWGRSYLKHLLANEYFGCRRRLCCILVFTSVCVCVWVCVRACVCVCWCICVSGCTLQVIYGWYVFMAHPCEDSYHNITLIVWLYHTGTWCTPANSHVIINQFCAAVLPLYSRYFVACKGDSAASSCQQSSVSCRAEVLPLAFVVSFLLIVARGHYLLALQSCGAFSPTRRLKGDSDFYTFPCYSVLLSWVCHLLLLGCLLIIAHPPKKWYISWQVWKYFWRPGIVILSLPGVKGA